MEFLGVVAAGAATWIFGAIWYMAIAKSWMEASGLNEESVNRSNPVPYVVSLIGAILVAGMLRHIMVTGGVETFGGAILTGGGLGFFVVSPWIVNNVLYGQRDKRLIWMDCGYPVVGMCVMAMVLILF